MLKKFTKKLRRPTPSPSTQSPGANNQRSDRWNELFNATQMILEITKESVKAVPVPALEAAVGGVAAVLNVYRVSTRTSSLIFTALRSLKDNAGERGRLETPW